MARIRTIKPDFFEDEKLARDLSRDCRLFYVALWNQADDSGRFRAHAGRLRGVIFPYDDDLSTQDVEGWIDTLAATGRVVLYVADGERYGHLTKFHKHQVVNRPSDPRHPAPEDGEIIDLDTDDSSSSHGALHEDSVSPHSGKGKGKGKGKGSSGSKEPGDWGRAAQLIREHWWRSKESPDPDWTMGNENTVWRQLANAYGPEIVTAAIPHVREHFDIDEPFTGKFVNARNNRDRLEQCIHAVRQAQVEVDASGGPVDELLEAMR